MKDEEDRDTPLTGMTGGHSAGNSDVTVCASEDHHNGKADRAATPLAVAEVSLPAGPQRKGAASSLNKPPSSALAPPGDGSDLDAEGEEYVESDVDAEGEPDAEGDMDAEGEDDIDAEGEPDLGEDDEIPVDEV